MALKIRIPFWIAHYDLQSFAFPGTCTTFYLIACHILGFKGNVGKVKRLPQNIEILFLHLLVYLFLFSPFPQNMIVCQYTNT
jgi:hypothetical protein